MIPSSLLDKELIFDIDSKFFVIQENRIFVSWLITLQNINLILDILFPFFSVNALSSAILSYQMYTEGLLKTGTHTTVKSQRLTEKNISRKAVYYLSIVFLFQQALESKDQW